MKPFAVRTLGAALIAVAMTVPVAAQDAPAAQNLPAAADIIAKYQAAVGGSDVLDGRTSIHSTGDVAIPAAGMTAQFESWQSRPNRTAMRATIAGFGEIRTGYTGDVAWSVNPMEGPRVMEGGEAAQSADEATFDWQLRRSDGVAAMTTVELTSMGGHECHKVRVEWKSGRESFDCYSTESGLIVGSTAQTESNMGIVEAVTLYDDYTDFEGMKVPGRVTIQTMGFEQIITVRTVTFNGVPDSVFEAPAEIRALIRP